MDIHISEQIGVGRVRSAILDHIAKSGHTVTEHLGFASYAVGYKDTDFGDLDPQQQIVIKEGNRPDEVVHRQGQKILHPGTMEMLGTGGKLLKQWLREAPDLLAPKL